jgi:hypothetical protein
MEKLMQRLTTAGYVLGALTSVISILAMPLTYGSRLWEVNLMIASVGVGVVALTALISAIALLSKNFPIPMSLVIGTVLAVAIAGQLEGPNAMLAFLQQVAFVLLGLFIVTRILVEAVENKKHAH